MELATLRDKERPWSITADRVIKPVLVVEVCATDLAKKVRQTIEVKTF